MLVFLALTIWTSMQVLGVLALILAGSSITFWFLVRRATSHRRWVSLAEWARETGFTLRACDPDRLPPPLDALAAQQPRIVVCATNKTSMIIQMQTVLSSRQLPLSGSTTVAWNLLVRHIESTWPPTGLRPSHDRRSALDLFSLSSFPQLGTTERFVVFGSDSTAARVLSQSMARSLLPPDIGLLLHGHELVLDFADRPFDTIEFNRMIALANQLAEKLPQGGTWNVERGV